VSPSWWGHATHPKELMALLRFKTSVVLPTIPKGIAPDSQYCYEKLQQTSRSFSTVILHLHPKLREAIAVFYLVCRAIDTIEDDMKPKKEEKIPHLRDFHQKLKQRGWKLRGYGDVPHEIDLLEQFDRVIEVYLTFPPEYQTVIADIAHDMGNGMADFLEKSVDSLQDYDLYCYYVAGLVGEGLSRLFAASGLEDKSFSTAKSLWNSMGLFLQKTNIIRDYKEDVEAVNPRVFYPKAIWGKYVKRVQDLKEPKYKKEALTCLNEMITNALQHVNHCIDYLAKLHEPTVFNFCAIPQTMAIATLALCYNNYQVFQKEVKIRKGEAVHLILSSDNLLHVFGHFNHYLDVIEGDIPSSGDPNAERLRETIAAIRKKIRSHPSSKS
jgi:farnesyl-diphosphate farnesyltransferase